MVVRYKSEKAQFFSPYTIVEWSMQSQFKRTKQTKLFAWERKASQLLQFAAHISIENVSFIKSIQ